MKIMLLGDTHGNTKFVTKYVIPAAVSAGVRWIYQLGDFGYWEHTEQGIVYLDEVNQECISKGLEIVFIQGNHDKVSMIPRKYSDVQGFYKVRSSIWFAPNGTVWSPNEGKTSFLALGGAYSIDKQERLDMERARAKQLTLSQRYQNFGTDYRMPAAYEETEHSLWFPEEEMSDVQFNQILSSVNEQVDVILAHDKPLGSNPPVKLINIPECEPNQRRLQEAVLHFKPSLFVHGHLHCRYQDFIRSGDDNSFTQVLGLGADVNNFNQPRSSWEPSDAWEILNL